MNRLNYLLVSLLLTAYSLVPRSACAANNLCRFSVANATYTELNGDTNITSAIIPDSFFTINALAGKTYPLLGQPWTIDITNRALSILPRGRLFLGLDTGFAIFDALYTDSVELIDATSKISYKIEGTGNAEILKVQWKNLKMGFGPAGNFVNFQMWLYRGTGVIEFRYGPRSANNASGYTVAQKALYIGIWYSNDDFSRLYEKMNLTGIPPAIGVDSVMNLGVPHIQGVPAEGTVYRFTPKGIATGIEELERFNGLFSAYPNPAGNMITIVPANSAGWNGKAFANLVDIDGRVLGTGIQANNTLLVRTGNVPAGVYMLQVALNGKIYSRKVVVQH